MAARFWVGGTGTWDASNTANWSATTGGAGGASVPTSADAVTIDAASGSGTITVNTNFTIQNLTCGAMTMTLDFATNNVSPTFTTTPGFSITGSGTRTINMGNGTFTFTGVGIVFNTSNNANLTFNEGNSTILCTNTGTPASVVSIIITNGVTLHTLTFNRGATTGNVQVNCTVTPATIRTLNDLGTGAHFLLFQQVRTFNIGNFNVKGSSGNLITIATATTTAAAAVLNKLPLGVVNTDYINNNINAAVNVTPTTLTWYIGTNSVAPGTGWISSNMPARSLGATGVG